MKLKPFGLMLCICASTATALPAIAADPSHLSSLDWRMQHLDAAGLTKCRAFRRVRAGADQLQKARGGSLTPLERRRLASELRHARAMPPARVTPAQCGVPL